MSPPWESPWPQDLLDDYNKLRTDEERRLFFQCIGYDPDHKSEHDRLFSLEDSKDSHPELDPTKVEPVSQPLQSPPCLPKEPSPSNSRSHAFEYAVAILGILVTVILWLLDHLFW